MRCLGIPFTHKAQQKQYAVEASTLNKFQFSMKKLIDRQDQDHSANIDTNGQ